MEVIDLKETLGRHFMPLKLGPTARDTLQEFIDIDVSADDLVRILNRNQAYRDLFSRFVNKKTGKQPKEGEAEKEGSPTHRLIALLGMIGSRNLILSLRMHRNAEGKFPIDAEGNVDLKAAEYLNRAMEIEESFVRNKLEYSETAFAAASYYDWFLRTQAKHPTFKKQEPYLQEIWKRGQRAGLIAYLLAQKVVGSTPKFAIAAGMLSQVGRLHMALRFGADYSDFETKIDAQKLNHVARLLQERDRFGLAHEEMASYSLFFYDVFQELEPCIRFYREPYCLKGGDHGQYTMALVLSLADSMARSWKIPVDEKDPTLAEWAAPWTKELRLRPQALIECMRLAMNIK
jgi:hypothetical protein